MGANREAREQVGGVPEESQDDESFDLGNAMNAKGDSQSSLRELRLQMYRLDDGQKTVPRARLSLALGELSSQDATIETLHQSLEDSKETLTEKEKELANAQGMCRSHQRSIEKIMAKASAKAKTLEEKIAKEMAEKLALEDKVDELEKEATRLKTTLQAAKVLLDKKAEMLLAASTDDGTARSSMMDDSADSSSGNPQSSSSTAISMDTEDSSQIVLMRAQIVVLKSRLADPQAEHVQRTIENLQDSPSRPVISKSLSWNHPEDAVSDKAEMFLLRTKLHTAEAELAALRSQDALRRIEPNTDVIELEQKLKDTEAELRDTHSQLAEAQTRAANLLEELESARRKIATSENKRSVAHLNSLAEVEKLKSRLKQTQEEAEDVKNQSLSELEHSRIEVTELQAEVKSLTDNLTQLTADLVVNATKHAQERERLEEALHRSKDAEHELRDKITALEERLAELEGDSAEEEVTWSENNQPRSVKRKLDEIFDSETGASTREAVQAEERTILKVELAKAKAAELALKEEIQVLKDLLQSAEDLTNKMATEFEEGICQRKDNEDHLLSELNDLRTKLVGAEEKALRAVTARDTDKEEHTKNEEALRQSHAKEQSLLNQIQVLKADLDRVASEREQEKIRSEELRQMQQNMDTKREEEISLLRAELESERVRANKASELESQVQHLRVRLATAEVEEKSMSREGKKQDEIGSKLSVIKGRLPSILSRNAAKRTKEQSLLNQIQVLKIDLDRVALEREQEKIRSEELRRIHQNMDTKREEEISLLRAELESERVRANKASELESQVQHLRVRLATAEVEEKSASREGKKQDEIGSKLSVTKGRLSSILSRNAAKQNAGDSSIDMSTQNLSGDSVSTIDVTASPRPPMPPDSPSHQSSPIDSRNQSRDLDGSLRSPKTPPYSRNLGASPLRSQTRQAPSGKMGASQTDGSLQPPKTPPYLNRSLGGSSLRSHARQSPNRRNGAKQTGDSLWSPESPRSHDRSAGSSPIRSRARQSPSSRNDEKQHFKQRNGIQLT